ncbi:HCL060Wp [Eremothecium sinecaudum]|uniref:HCL060Wp n=1 Tax=Eremothecium sinecaudum TaxID=45286 RepID=A0A0X8HRF9_9SACH|nr:HCL060Wp [Eremothecium sinecaudum]AMD20091.1 HCL060Wp [Eremothecium sinecaudum]
MAVEPSREDDEQHSLVTRSGSSDRRVQKKPSLTHSTGHVKHTGDGDGEVVRGMSLNAYSLKPTTVPPFALDAHFKRLKLKDSAMLSKDKVTSGTQRFKDPFLVSYDSQWNEFVNNIDAEGRHPKQRTKNSVSLHPQSGTSTSSTSSLSSISKMEKMRAITQQHHHHHHQQQQLSPNRSSSLSILTDLESNWGGEERLNAIFEAPILHDYEFKNQKDRNEWTKYISQLKHFYYGSIFKGSNSRNVSLESDDDDDDDDVGRLQAFMEKHKLEFRRKKQYWLQFEQRKKQQWGPSFRKLLLDNQYLPLSFRLIIIMLTCVALGLAVRIFENSHHRLQDRTTNVPQQPSTIMAIVVNTVAIVYLIYIAYDEFSGKPLGLRNPLGKMRLILLDLLFIIFSSANLSLAFNTLYDKTWVCAGDDDSSAMVPKIDYICRKQRALSAFLFLVLFMWVITFTISILRVVERVSSTSPR